MSQASPPPDILPPACAADHYGVHLPMRESAPLRATGLEDHERRLAEQPPVFS
ncbi:hypothetical protein ACFYQ5_31595 [Streptomyces sp. NPDC005794]|uniref:hypothetical protein n=1 Tax=Streptomyces sp. NPDC005794 TaxID=3364733 RepID=UPI003680E1C1